MSVGNDDEALNARTGSPQDSSIPAISVSIFENVPKRARNNCQPQSSLEQVNVPNQQAPPVVHIDTTNLARTMAAVMAEKERYKKPGDIIKHAKKCRAYDFYSTLDPGQAEKWVKIMDKGFTTLQLIDKESYGIMFDKADEWLTQVKNLFGEDFT